MLRVLMLAVMLLLLPVGVDAAVSDHTYTAPGVVVAEQLSSEGQTTPCVSPVVAFVDYYSGPWAPSLSVDLLGNACGLSQWGLQRTVNSYFLESCVDAGSSVTCQWTDHECYADCSGYATMYADGSVYLEAYRYFEQDFGYGPVRQGVSWSLWVDSALSLPVEMP